HPGERIRARRNGAHSGGGTRRTVPATSDSDRFVKSAACRREVASAETRENLRADAKASEARFGEGPPRGKKETFAYSLTGDQRRAQTRTTFRRIAQGSFATSALSCTPTKRTVALGRGEEGRADAKTPETSVGGWRKGRQSAI